MCRWKNYENRSTFVEVMIKSQPIRLILYWFFLRRSVGCSIGCALQHCELSDYKYNSMGFKCYKNRAPTKKENKLTPAAARRRDEVQLFDLVFARCELGLLLALSSLHLPRLRIIHCLTTTDVRQKSTTDLSFSHNFTAWVDLSRHQ